MESIYGFCYSCLQRLLFSSNERSWFKGGIIVILHPFGKDLRFQPHLHLLITEGGFTRRGKFIKREFIPARKFARCWQYHVLANFQKHGLPSWLATEMYERYDGFYVWLHRAGKIKHPKQVAKYTGRYVRHPAIANSRLTEFDGAEVHFYGATKKK